MRTGTALAASALLLTGCASGSNGAGHHGSGADGGKGSAASPTASATPTHDPDALKPGTNHSHAAAEAGYVYKTKDVHDWLWGKKEESPTYPAKKTAFLTFDDGPTGTTPSVLRELRANKVHATFFVIGNDLGVKREGSHRRLRQEIAQGHSVGIHSYTHNFHNLYPGRVANAKSIVKERNQTLRAIRHVLGDDYDTHAWRYPGGHGWNKMAPADKALKNDGAYWIDWNAENGDGTDQAAPSGSGRAQQALGQISSKPGVVVILMHDYKENKPTVDAITPIVKKLKKWGYTFGVMD